MDFNIILYIFFGVLPSLVWLLYYMLKDLHPEPKRMIIRIFLWGVFIAIPVFFVESGFTKILNIIVDKQTNELIFNIISWFFVISFTEELFKYLVVKVKVINSPHMDEPLDIMLYMTVAALGFAAIENVLYLLSFNEGLDNTLLLDAFRSISAVFLHTLSSAVLGYFLALSFYYTNRRRFYVITGILLAAGLHGLFDFSIMTLHGNIRYIIPAVIIVTLAFLTFMGFEKLKKMKSVCKIK